LAETQPANVAETTMEVEEDVKPDISMNTQKSEDADEDEEKPDTEDRENQENPERPKKRIEVRFVSQNSYEIAFRISKTTKMKKVMETFAKNMKCDISELRFQFGNDRVKSDDTPESLGLENDDKVDVFTKQQGGGESAQ